MAVLRALFIAIHLFVKAIISNTYTSNNGTLWQSTSPFIPRNSSRFGHIRLWEEMSLSLIVQWNGRTSPSSGEYEQIMRVGWPATAGGCASQNSRYPSLWIDDDTGLILIDHALDEHSLGQFVNTSLCTDILHLSISDDSNCGKVGMIHNPFTANNNASDTVYCFRIRDIL